jgi:hypothetical protein
MYSRSSFRPGPTFLALTTAEPEPAALLAELLAADPALMRREEQALAIGSRAGLPIRPIGTMPLFAGYRYYEAEPHDWVLVNLADDPLARHPEGFPIPRATLGRLRALRRGGVSLDAIAVAHEVRKGSLRPGEPLSLELLLPGPSRPAVRSAELLGWAARAAWLAATLPAAAAGLLGAGTAATAAATGMGIADLDPILVGALVEPGRPVEPGQPARWLYLDSWAYAERK